MLGNNFLTFQIDKAFKNSTKFIGRKILIKPIALKNWAISIIYINGIANGPPKNKIKTVITEPPILTDYAVAAFFIISSAFS